MPSYAGMARSIAAAGAFVVSLDSTVNVAFPAIAATFGLAPEALRWVIVGYVFTYALTSFVGGALADRLGHARVFVGGLVLGTIGFVVAGTSPTFAVLLAGRVIQGLGAGLVYGTAPGLVTLGTPPAARGRQLGLLNAAIGAALAVGPLLAGLLIESAGWRWVFHLRVPLALLVFVWAMLGLSTTAGPPIARLVSASDLGRARVLGPSALAFVANGAIFAIWLLAPFYLISGRGLDTRTAGVLFMLTPLGTALAALSAGRLADRLGARLPTVVGLAVEAAGLLLLSNVGPRTPVAALALAFFAAGFGLGLFQVPNMASVMVAFPAALQGAAGGVAFLARTLGVVAGVQVLAAVFASRRVVAGPETAFAEAFLLAALAAGGAAAVAVFSRRSWSR